MSLDPPFTAEFADAGFLAEVPQDAKAQLEKQGSFKGAIDAATWEDKLVVFPFWSNTQVLWYRKSFVDKAGIDMTQPVTWDQIIQAAADNGGPDRRAGQQVRGLQRLDQRAHLGRGRAAGGERRQGRRPRPDDRQPQGEDAAKVIEELATPRPLPPTVSVVQRGHGGLDLRRGHGSFMVNWTYIFHNYDETAPDVAKDIGYTRYPQTVEGEESRPPYGGIGIGVSEYSDHKDLALEAAACLVSRRTRASTPR